MREGVERRKSGKSEDIYKYVRCLLIFRAFSLKQYVFYFKLTAMPFKFEKLTVWQKALDLTGVVNDVSKKFPREETFVLTAQIKRAADSICLNIAEGSTSLSNTEFSRFLQIALRSNIEVVGCIFIAKKRNIITEADFSKIYCSCEEILAMISGLRRSLNQ